MFLWRVLGQKKIGGKEDHIRYAQLVLDGMSIEEVRKKAWEEEKLLLSPSVLSSTLAEIVKQRRLEQVKQEEVKLEDTQLEQTEAKEEVK